MKDIVLALAAVLVLGWPLAFALTGRWLLGTLLAPLTAGLLATVCAVFMIVIGGRLEYWLVPAWVAGLALAWWVGHRRTAALPHAGPIDLAFFTVPLVPPALDVLQPPIIWDAHAIWWAHAGMLTNDGAYVRYMLGEPAFGYSHTDYPLLVPSTVATGWTAGGVDFFAAQFVTTALTLSAIVMLAYAVRTVTAGGPVWASRIAASAVALTVWVGSPLLVAAGYVDHLWASAAVAGALLLLVRPPGSAAAGSAGDDSAGDESGPVRPLLGHLLPVLLLTVAASTKNEGLIVAGIVAVVATARTWRTPRRTALVWIPIAAGLLWKVVSRAFGAESDLLAGGGFGDVLSFDGNVRWRFRLTVEAMWNANGWLVATAVAVTVVGALLLRRYRTRAGIGADWPLWVVAALYLAALGGTYLITPHDIRWHLLTSIDRTMVVVTLIAAASAACWMVTAAGALLSPSGGPSPSSTEDGPAPASSPADDGPATADEPAPAGVPAAPAEHHTPVPSRTAEGP